MQKALEAEVVVEMQAACISAAKLLQKGAKQKGVKMTATYIVQGDLKHTAKSFSNSIPPLHITRVAGIYSEEGWEGNLQVTKDNREGNQGLPSETRSSPCSWAHSIGWTWLQGSRCWGQSATFGASLFAPEVMKKQILITQQMWRLKKHLWNSEAALNNFSVGLLAAAAAPIR